jgi:hypothetical protein
MKLISSVYSGSVEPASKAVLFGTALALAALHSQAACVPDPQVARVSWTMPIVGATRFDTLANFNCAAVLDRNTGLVWEQSPSTQTYTWANAMQLCSTKIAGGTMGWRLPTTEEIGTLTVFLSQGISSYGIYQTTYGLPTGHPFGAATGVFWSSTNLASDVTQALAWQQPWVNSGISPFPSPPVPASPLMAQPKTNQSNRAWCVRGS